MRYYKKILFHTLVAIAVSAIATATSTYAHDLKGIFVELNSSTSPSIAQALAETPTADANTRSVLNNLRLWPVPRKLTVCFHAGTQAVRKRVTEAMRRTWPLATLTQGRLDFDADSLDSAKDCSKNPSQDIRIDFKAGDGYWSYVGVESRLYSRSMNLQGFTESSPDDKELDRLVAHETGHALGLEHEHQSIRAPRCQWDFDYIWKNYAWDSKKEMRNNFNKLKDYIENRKHAYIFSTYDPKSIMHYSFEGDAFLDKKKDPCFIEQNFTVSDQDKNAMRIAYGPEIVASQVQMKNLIPNLPNVLLANTLVQLQPILKTKAELLGN